MNNSIKVNHSVQNLNLLKSAGHSITALFISLSISFSTNAAIVYHDIPDLVADESISGASSSSFTIDLNNDGNNDFTFSHFYYYDSWYEDFFGEMVLFEDIWGRSSITGSGASNGVQAYPVTEGNEIPGTRYTEPFYTTDVLLGCYDSRMGNCGYWYDVSNYLAFQFDIEGQIHYGWAHLSINEWTGGVTLHDYAYESIAGEAIIAGAGVSSVPIPATAPLFIARLSLLSLAFRRKKV